MSVFCLVHVCLSHIMDGAVNQGVLRDKGSWSERHLWYSRKQMCFFLNEWRWQNLIAKPHPLMVISQSGDFWELVLLAPGTLDMFEIHWPAAASFTVLLTFIYSGWALEGYYACYFPSIAKLTPGTCSLEPKKSPCSASPYFAWRFTASYLDWSQNTPIWPSLVWFWFL